MDKEIIDKAINAVFEIIKEREKANKLNDMQKNLNFNSDSFSFGSLLDINEDKFVNFLDWFFYGLSKAFEHPDDDVGGLVSYTLYDAATPYLDGKPYYLKDKNDFKNYVYTILNIKD